MRVINGRFPSLLLASKASVEANGFSFAARVASLVLFLLFMVFAHEGRTQPGHTVRFINGYWFNGTSSTKKRLRRRRRCLFAGVLTYQRTIDLRGGYVVPPFTEAHNHNVESLNNIDALIANISTSRNCLREESE